MVVFAVDLVIVTRYSERYLEQFGFNEVLIFEVAITGGQIRDNTLLYKYNV